MRPNTHFFTANHYKGLTSLQASQLIKTIGPNTLPTDKRRSLAYIALDTLIEPMSLLLLAAGIIYLLLGDLMDALMLLAFVLVLLGISVFQQNKTERALTALRNLSSPRALVIREGEQKRIAGSEVVPGDIAFLKEGDRVPADGVILSSINLTVDESILTGESAPVHKLPDDENVDANPSRVYSGTLVVQGQAFMQVKFTGVQTEIGKISKAIQSLPEEKTFLKHEMEKLVKYFALAGFILCVILVTLYGLTRGNWLDAFLAGITLAMAMIPEEFPVVLTIFMALGAWRLSQHQVLIRRVPMVEALGAATVLCVDKTGTLTENKMIAKTLVTPNEQIDLHYQTPQELPEEFHLLVEYGILASQRDPYDPMEKSIHEIGSHYLANTEHIHKDWSLVHEYPLSKELMAMSLVWESTERDLYTIAAKGAPEAIIDLCHLPSEQAAPILRQVAEMAERGLRIIAVARSSFKPPMLPEIQHDFDFEYLGLIGLVDPVRPTASAAIKQCYEAGIRVIMITGDYPQTAGSIAKEIGIINVDRIITGDKLNAMTDAEFANAVTSVNIFARMVPEQKLRLVQALKNKGEIVAMTGDGVNDAPALKAANIGLAMGGRGTDVAREASGIVLLDDDFSAIVYAVKIGRRIFDNVRKAISYVLSIHVPICGLSLIPVLVDWPLILLPIHVAFLHLIIDPACSVVFEAEPEAKNIMQRPPRKANVTILTSAFWSSSLLKGSSILITILCVYGISLNMGYNLSSARTLGFTTLIIANLSLIISNCSWNLFQTTRSLKLVIGGALLFLAFLLYVPALRNIFHFDLMTAVDLSICFSAGILSVAWMDMFGYIKNYFRLTRT